MWPAERPPSRSPEAVLLSAQVPSAQMMSAQVLSSERARLPSCHSWHRRQVRTSFDGPQGESRTPRTAPRCHRGSGRNHRSCASVHGLLRIGGGVPFSQVTLQSQVFFWDDYCIGPRLSATTPLTLYLTGGAVVQPPNRQVRANIEDHHTSMSRMAGATDAAV